MKGVLTAAFALSLSAGAAMAAPLSAEALERWFQSDDPAPPDSSVADVNGGHLSFLHAKPARPVHHHQNALSIAPSSLRDGWVRLAQCHHNLDAVSRVHIQFRPGRVRDLVIRRADNIGDASVEGASVKLTDVGHGASLCLEAWTRALRQNDDGTYSLRSGPFMRKFLDGYYPMQVSMKVDFTDSGLDPVAITPAAQKGFEIERGTGELSYEAWFEGRLVTEITFAD